MHAQATLLVVDDVLLLRIAKDILQLSCLDDDSTPETGGSLLQYILSFWLAGRRTSAYPHAVVIPAGSASCQAVDQAALRLAGLRLPCQLEHR